MNISSSTDITSSQSWLLDTAIIGVLGLLSALLLLTNINQPLFLALNSLFSFLPDSLWVFLTNGGDAAVALSLLIGLSRHRNSKTVVFSSLMTAIALTLVVQGLKFGLGVERPPQVLAQDAFHLIGGAIHSKSFPSGHTATAFCVAGILAAQYRGHWFKVALITIATLIGLSRVAVGVHWPTDIAEGALIGWILGYYLFAIIERAIAEKQSYILIGFVFSVVLLVLMFFRHLGNEPVFAELLLHRIALVTIALGTAIQFIRLDLESLPWINALVLKLTGR
jgi:membrane-associated phospholipid phosphatase